MWGIASVLWRDSISTVGIASVLWRLFSTVEASVHVGDSISSVGGSIITGEAIQYCGGIASVL